MSHEPGATGCDRRGRVRPTWPASQPNDLRPWGMLPSRDPIVKAILILVEDKNVESSVGDEVQVSNLMHENWLLVLQWRIRSVDVGAHGGCVRVPFPPAEGSAADAVFDRTTVDPPLALARQRSGFTTPQLDI